jgi:hypothetical protein
MGNAKQKNAQYPMSNSLGINMGNAKQKNAQYPMSNSLGINMGNAKQKNAQYPMSNSLVGDSFRSHYPTIHTMLNNPSLKVANSIGSWLSRNQNFKVFFGY